MSAEGFSFITPVSAVFGGAAGGYLCFPFEGLKKRLQSGQPITASSFHPTELFRGSIPFATSVMAATVASMTLHKALQTRSWYDSSSPTCEAGSAMMSGALGAVVGSTPVENVILTQQLNKTGPFKAVRILFKQGISRPWLGLPELMMREAGFAGSMLWGGRAAKNVAYEKTQSEALSHVAEFGACILGAVITHPADTLATHKQKNNGALSSSQAVKNIFQKHGLLGFFRGCSHRIFLFTGCAVLIPRIEKRAHDILEKVTSDK